jgi:hypothetical protein
MPAETSPPPVKESADRRYDRRQCIELPTLANLIERLQGAARLSDYDRQNIGRIIGGEGVPGDYFTNFSSHLLRLIKKADPDNRRAIALVYPEHVAALEEWERTAL